MMALYTPSLSLQRDLEHKEYSSKSLYTMGKVCCSESDDAASDITKVLMVIILAFVLMIICSPRPRPTHPCAIYRCRWLLAFHLIYFFIFGRNRPPRAGNMSMYQILVMNKTSGLILFRNF